MKRGSFRSPRNKVDGVVPGAGIGDTLSVPGTPRGGQRFSTGRLSPSVGRDSPSPGGTLEELHYPGMMWDDQLGDLPPPEDSNFTRSEFLSKDMALNNFSLPKLNPIGVDGVRSNKDSRRVFTRKSDIPIRDSRSEMIQFDSKHPDDEFLEERKIQTEYNFHDVVDEDLANHMDEFVQQDLIGTLLESSVFRNFILAIIICNSLTIGLQTDPSLAQNSSTAFAILDLMFLTIYVVEILLKWKYDFAAFWKSGWNLFDFFIVFVSLLTFFLSRLGGALSNAKILRVLRVLRAFRTLRGIAILSSLRSIVTTILKAMPDMVNIALLLLIFMFIYCVIGVNLFGQISPQYFGTILDNCYVLMTLLTQDGWLDVRKDLDENGANMLAVSLYMISFVIGGSFVFINVVVGVIVTQLETTFQEEKRLKEASIDITGLGASSSAAQLLKLLSSQTSLTKEIDVEKISSIEHIEPEIWANQDPLELKLLSNLNSETFQNYCLVLMALEDNLAEYKELTTDLEAMRDEIGYFRDVLELFHDSDEEEDLDEEEEEQRPQGDVLSRIIKREQNKAKKTKKKEKSLSAKSIERLEKFTQLQQAHADSSRVDQDSDDEEVFDQEESIILRNMKSRPWISAEGDQDVDGESNHSRSPMASPRTRRIRGSTK